MWVFTTTGFISAVQKYGESDLTVRSRDRLSLEGLATASGSKITPTPYGDYPYRLTCSHAQFMSWLSTEASRVDYSNFKSQVEIERGYKFARPLNEVWSVMHAVEDVDARGKNDDTSERGNNE